MATPSAAQVFTGVSGGRGDNSGAAAVLDHHPDFLPYAKEILKQRTDENLKKAEQKKAKDKNWYDLQKSLDPKATWAYTQKYMQDKAKAMRDKMVDYKMKGSDPTDPGSDMYGELEKYKQEIEDDVKSAAIAEKGVQGVIAQVNKGGYDRDYTTKWLEGFKDKSPQEQEEYFMTTNPLRKEITDLEVVDETAPELFTQVLGGKSITELRAIDYAPVLDSFLTTEKGQEHYSQGVEDGKYKDADGYKEYMTNLAKSMRPGKESPTSKGSTGSGGHGGGGGSKPKLSFGIDTVKTTGVANDGKPNLLKVNRAGTQDDLPPFRIVADDGKAIDFQPVEFVVGGNGRIGVKGIKYTPKTTGGIQVAADGSVSIGGGGAPQEEVWIDYDRNEAAFDAQLGVNIYDKLGRARPTGGTSTQPNKSETAVERAVRIANGG